MSGMLAKINDFTKLKSERSKDIAIIVCCLLVEGIFFAEFHDHLASFIIHSFCFVNTLIYMALAIILVQKSKLSNLYSILIVMIAGMMGFSLAYQIFLVTARALLASI